MTMKDERLSMTACDTKKQEVTSMDILGALIRGLSFTVSLLVKLQRAKT